MLRSARDHLADCLSTLPAIIEQGNIASLHFYIGNLTHMRKDLFPGLLSAYDSWINTSDFSRLKEITEQGASHWKQVCQSVLDTWQNNRKIETQTLVNIIENNKL